MTTRVFGKESGCPKCDVVKSKLDKKNIEYEYITDIEMVTEALQKAKTMFTPVIEVDGTLYNFTQANALINNM